MFSIIRNNLRKYKLVYVYICIYYMFIFKNVQIRTFRLNLELLSVTLYSCFIKLYLMDIAQTTLKFSQQSV